MRTPFTRYHHRRYTVQFSFNQFTTERLTEALATARVEVEAVKKPTLRGIVEAWIGAAQAELDDREEMARRRVFWPLLDAELTALGQEVAGLGECHHVFSLGFPPKEAAEVVMIYRRAQAEPPRELPERVTLIPAKEVRK